MYLHTYQRLCRRHPRLCRHRRQCLWEFFYLREFDSGIDSTVVHFTVRHSYVVHRRYV